MKWFTFFITLFLQFSIISAKQEDILKVDVFVDKGDDATYYDEEPIFISFLSTQDAYIVIYDIDTEGKLNLIYPESVDEEGFVRGNKTYQIPEEDDEYSFKVSGPPGEEFICVVASSEPLRIPSIFGEEDETQFRFEGDPKKAIERITDDILEGNSGEYATDISHFYVEYSEEGRDFLPPPSPPLPYPPLFSSIEIISRPSGAKIYLDGRYFGKTPKGIAGIPPGLHRLLLKKGYYRYAEDIHLYNGERKKVKVYLKWKLW